MYPDTAAPLATVGRKVPPLREDARGDRRAGTHEERRPRRMHDRLTDRPQRVAALAPGRSDDHGIVVLGFLRDHLRRVADPREELIDPLVERHLAEDLVQVLPSPGPAALDMQERDASVARAREGGGEPCRELRVPAAANGHEQAADPREAPFDDGDVARRRAEAPRARRAEDIPARAAP